MAARASASVEDPRAAVTAPRAVAAPRGSRERPVPGLSLHRGPDGVWRRFGPVDELLRITGPDAPVAAVVAWLQGGAREHPGDAILDTARALGLLEPEPLPAPVATRVAVVGGGPVARELRRLLEAQGWRVEARTRVAQAAHPDAANPPTADEPTSDGRAAADAAAADADGHGATDADPDGDARAADPDGLATADVVVVVDELQRDAAWSALDARLTAAGTPWHRAFREGRRWVVGPFWTGPGAASYRDYRVRRLAADAQPDELEARWRAADATPSADDPETTRPEGPDHSGRPARPAATLGGPDDADPFAAVVAAWIAHDLAAQRDGRPVPGQDAEVLLDPETGSVERHPVLALPPAPTA